MNTELAESIVRSTGVERAGALPSPKGRGVKRQRRGVLLLVVLSMLVLFALIAITFVLVAGHYKRTSRIESRVEQQASDPKRELEFALMQVLRGTKAPRVTASYNPDMFVRPSPLSLHSLLEDMYGSDSFPSPLETPFSSGLSIEAQCTVNSCTQRHSGQMLDLVLNVPTPPMGDPAMKFPLSATGGYYNGCVFTITSGKSAGQSARVVGYDATTYTVRVMAFENSSTTTPLPGSGGDPAPRYLINGHAFNGTGFGYNPATGLVDAQQTLGGIQCPMAFVPGNVDANYLQYSLGGMDEDYDAPDHQNMFLGAYLFSNPSTSLHVLPSFHRPEMFTWWSKKIGGAMSPGNGTDLPSDTLQRICLRPMNVGMGRNGTPNTSGPDHPNFTGSNPNFHPVNGPWDVDNDGDGVPDSIWMDLGAPVQTAADGRRYKRLYAIFCVDMDGRLNVNAHGNVAHAQQIYTNTPLDASTVGGYFAGNTLTPTLPRGMGYGPPEVNLLGLFSSTQAFTQMLGGDTIYEGRYGEYSLYPNLASGGGYYPNPPLSTPVPLAGLTDGNQDRWSIFKEFDYPFGWGSLSDYKGTGVVGLDLGGQPIRLGNEGPLDLVENSYQIDLSRKAVRAALNSGAVDNPFTAAEQERILRPFDSDAASLPGRLDHFLPPPSSGVPHRTQVTTDSYDVPVPSVLPPGQGSGMSGVDSLRQTFLNNGKTASNLTILDLIKARYPNLNDVQIAQMLPPEILAGQRFDINRAFGNGRDDNGNNVVDEPQEAAAEAAWNAIFGSNVQFWLTGGLDTDQNNPPSGTVNALDQQLARHLMARYLYVLMTLLSDMEYHAWTNEPGLTPPAQRELTAQRIAQWAINVVDFRDVDNIMTPFEYDLDLTDGWNVDGFIGMTPGPDGQFGTGDDVASPDDGQSYRRVVWGCEFPVLLLTESGAWHDRRTEDLTTPGMKTSDMPPDMDFDQRRLPEGSAFFELYCTKDPHNVMPVQQDIFRADGALDLGKMSPDNLNPVWRLAISQSKEQSPNNDMANRMTRPNDHTTPQPEQPSLIPTLKPEPPVTIDRIVWFTKNKPNAMSVTNSDLIYTNYATNNNVVLQAGQYAVVGPYRHPKTGMDNISTMGFSSTSPYVQEIRLGNGGPASAVNVNNPDGTNSYPSTTNDIQPIVSIPVAGDPTITGAAAGWSNPIGFSISEPLFSKPTYYTFPTDVANTTSVTHYDGAVTTHQDLFNPPLNNPLDHSASRPLGQDGIYNAGTVLGYKTVFLQRLADPTRAYDMQANPYITVDYMPIDLTVFNGQADTSGATQTSEQAIGGIYFKTRQKGFPRSGQAVGTNSFNLWTQPDWTNAATYNPISNPTAPSHFWPYAFDNTLGYINSSFHAPFAIGSKNWINSTTAAPNGGSIPASYYGDPLKPFPWLSWNNRPYVSNFELLMVPASSPQRLLYDFTMGVNGTSPNWTDPYQNPRTSFHHLLNFFQTDPNPAPAVGNAPHYYRALEYLHVPSRFVNTDTALAPASFAAPDPNYATENRMGFYARAPFNKVSNFRDPGRININTIPGSAFDTPIVWNGVAPRDDVGNPYPNWQSIFYSRQGYDASTALGTYPTRYTNPFRSASGAALTNSAFTVSGASPATRSEIDVTLMRHNDPPTSGTTPLFDFDTNTDDLTNSYRNPYFRYQNLQRVSNVLTTRSNVYAVWITVGYFEVTPWQGSPAGAATVYDIAHPDGYQLGAEIGSDTGDITRHRGFYMIDRTIPVGFQRGQDLNVDRAVILKRFIE